MKKLQSIKSKLIAPILGVLLLLVWELADIFGWLPQFIIPAPSAIFRALVAQREALFANSLITLTQALIGLGIGIVIAFVLAVMMDRMPFVRRAIYPYLVVSQTIPTVAIAPILVLWLGYGMLPKIVLVILTTLFPIVINILEGFNSVNKESIDLLSLMGANYWQILIHVKLPTSLSYFFSGLKISVSYAFVASVIAEWLGGFEGLGVYMIRAKNAFSYPNMFAAIVVVSLVSLLLLGVVSMIERLLTPWEYKDYKEEN